MLRVPVVVRHDGQRQHPRDAQRQPVRIRPTRGALALGLVLLGAAGVSGACSQQPPPVLVRTFERAQRMDVVCLRLFDVGADQTRTPREPLGRPVSECAPVAQEYAGVDYESQLFALVTQGARGELAVVNLTTRSIIDQSRALPGTNFLPVGAAPTDVAAAPDGKMAFVASAEVNKPAIYGIATRHLLADTEGFPHGPEPLTLASWPVCALPQNPGALTVVPRAAVAATVGGGGSSEANSSGTGSDEPDYVVAAALPGDRRHSAKIVFVDPRPFVRGALPKVGGQPDYAKEPTLKPGPVLEPGSLAPCPVLAAMELAGGSSVPDAFTPGGAWDRGLRFAAPTVDLTCKRPALSAQCAAASCCTDAGSNPAGASDKNAECNSSSQPTSESKSLALNLGPLEPPKPVALVRDDQTLYIADGAVPFVHVVDVSDPRRPRELAPLVATSVSSPSRPVRLKALAVSPPTRDFKRFVYAVDEVDGSILVFDVTEPSNKPRMPLQRPYPELHPFQASDRLSFDSPVVDVAFARHDIPLTTINGVPTTSAVSGVLCNPNPNLDAAPQKDFGFYYRANSTDPIRGLGPRRLRGVFAFATLANGRVVVIDVDDWDGPCRRPASMSESISDVTPPQPAPSSAADIDPLHAPVVSTLAVTNEGFYPMSAPHSPRSAIFFRNDAQFGNLLPRLQTVPTVSANGIVLAQTGPTSADTPQLSVPHFATENPHAHFDQDWRITWEGTIASFGGAPATMRSDDEYASLVLSQSGARFCATGVEDRAVSQERADRIKKALAEAGATSPVDLSLMNDYVQIADDVLPANDPYWESSQGCWDPALTTASARHAVCEKTFGFAVDQSSRRDYPVIEAFDDRLVIGRYSSRSSSTGTVREIVSKSPSNAADLKLLQCCFRGEARVRVRTGQSWSVVGVGASTTGAVGFLHHIEASASGRCVSSCESRQVLLNGRVPLVPSALTSVNRNSPLGLRNPIFDFVINAGVSGAVPARDTVISFATRGQIPSLTIAIGGSSSTVSPQSMRYIDVLGQIGVVDAAANGLVMIDLGSVDVARTFF